MTAIPPGYAGPPGQAGPAVSRVETEAGPTRSGPDGRRTARLHPLIALLVAQLVVGVLLGLIWLSWAPRTLSYLLDNGNGGSLIIPDESESQVAGDGRFVVLSVLAGLAFGLIAWRLRRLRGPLTLAVLGVGSVLGSLLARTTGQLLSGGKNTAPLNTAFHPRLSLHASAALWLQALFAVLLYTALVGLSSDQHLGRGEPRPEPEPGPALTAG
ncbi:MAG: hypothetical protein ACR2N4_05500 [Jatrophihabitans sp.]